MTGQRRSLKATLLLVLLLSAGCSTAESVVHMEPLGEGEPAQSQPTAARVEQERPTSTADTEEGEPQSVAEESPQGGDMTFHLNSEAFNQGERIPQRYSCDGEDISPPLRWTDPPEGTQSFALVMDDPDAPMGTWVHWVLYNVPPGTRMLAEGFPSDPQISSGARNGHNSWSRMGYGGPCPPSGSHRYFFRIYALDQILTLAPGADKAQLIQTIQGHILAEAELMGTYQR